ncbi:thioredoxin-like 3-2, chloroplastic [Salvia miltiorrhiza]|uniref:thioredoxin-like 3-2, chloroplastic n=1 Tax=Salvia miltiorrhiza TaxID=226208 RepID=UPI0025ACBA8A|nr:thioredoxin-like 3-2, chloroplastic [Salvia miltiorrhiza]
MEILPSVKTRYSRIPPSHNPCRFINSSRKFSFLNGDANPVSRNNSSFHQMKGRKLVISSSSDESGPIAQRSLENSPLSMELVPISGEAQFDRVVAESQQLAESVVILWMASWCRKCIYLKPKLEKLAADYYPRIRFYSVDVNSVPHKLVVRAEVTKMPTIQLWRDGKKQAEVIGSHKAYLVVNEVREIIENENSL